MSGFDGERAFRLVQAQCALGPRPTGSPANRRCAELIASTLAECGWPVEEDAFLLRGQRCRNLLARTVRERPALLLGAHFDTRPRADRERSWWRRRRAVPGANDGASGVAVLMELAHQMAAFDSRYGVDFALFDGEEFIFREDHEFFRGSQFFADQYRKRPPNYRYAWGVLLDMVADKDLQLYQEGHSVSWRDTRPLVEQIWGTARRLGVREFIPQVKHYVRDDHLPLRNTAGIPTCDIIDFDYPPWHTQGDTPDKCSALSLAKVGWVIHEWLKSLK